MFRCQRHGAACPTRPACSWGFRPVYTSYVDLIGAAAFRRPAATADPDPDRRRPAA